MLPSNAQGTQHPKPAIVASVDSLVNVSLTMQHGFACQSRYHQGNPQGVQGLLITPGDAYGKCSAGVQSWVNTDHLFMFSGHLENTASFHSIFFLFD